MVRPDPDALAVFERCALTAQWRNLPIDIRHHIFYVFLYSHPCSARSFFKIFPVMRTFLGTEGSRSVPTVPPPPERTLPSYVCVHSSCLECRRGVYGHYVCFYDSQVTRLTCENTLAITDHGLVGVVIMVVYARHIPLTRSLRLCPSLSMWITMPSTPYRRGRTRPCVFIRAARGPSTARTPYPAGDTYSVCTDSYGEIPEGIRRPVHHVMRDPT